MPPLYREHSFNNAERANRPNWPSDPIYSDWRVDIPKVDETNAEAYLQHLQTRKLAYDEINRLIYILPDFDLEFMSQDEQDCWAKAEPRLDFIVNFDEHLFVQRAYDAEQIALNINPTAKFAPSHWTCHQDDTYKYLPDNLRSLWGES